MPRGLAVLFWLTLCLAGPTHAESREFKVGVYDNEPKLFIAPNGQASGILWDILAAIAEQENWTLKAVPCTWQDCLQALQDKQIDLLPDVALSEQRAQRYDFHKTAALHSWSQIYRQEGTPIHSMLDLQGKRIAVLKDSIQESYLRDLLSGFGVNAELVYVTSFDAGFQQLAARKVDAAVSNRFFGEQKAGLYQLVGSQIMFQPARLFYATAKGNNAEVLEAIDRHLDAWLKSDASPYFKILEQWMPHPPQRAIPIWFFAAGGALVTILLLALFGNMLLRRKVAEQTAHLLRDKQALELQALALAQIQDHVTVTDLDGKITYVNRAELDGQKHREEDIVGKTTESYGDDPRADAQQKEILEQTLSRGTWQGEVINHRRDGSEIFLNLRTSLLRDDDNQPVALVGIATDITEQKLAGIELEKYRNGLELLIAERTRELEQAKQLAESANLAKSSFLANMSHEIRTPLNAITGMAHMIRRSGLSAKQSEQMDKLENAGEHLLDIINAILDISKIEAGMFVLEETALSIEEIVSRVREMIAERAADKQLQLISKLGTMPENLLGDRTRIQQALLNYATNAIKFTESGSVTFAANIVEEDSLSAMIRFEVSDTGIGIVDDAFPRLFNAFEQADNSITRKYGGTGLGLAITRRLAELMGGKAGVSSVLGKGSTFWLTVRLRKGEATQPAPLTLSISETEKLLKTLIKGSRILLAEDEPINREIGLAMFEEIGVVVDTAEDGLAAVKLASENHYALILMDMQMPGLDGLEATRLIRQLSAYRQVPIIAMTANAFAEDKARCLEAGMNDFISKPVHPEILFKTLLKCLTHQGRLTR